MNCYKIMQTISLDFKDRKIFFIQLHIYSSKNGSLPQSILKQGTELENAANHIFKYLFEKVRTY